jgi:hypothetical protein
VYPEAVRSTVAESSIPKVSQVTIICGDGYRGHTSYMVKASRIDPLLFEAIPNAPPSFGDMQRNVFIIANERGVMSKIDWMEYMKSVAIPMQMQRYPNGGPLVFLYDCPSVHGTRTCYVMVVFAV